MKSKTRAKPAPAPLKDLIVLAADKNISSAIEGILSRPRPLGIRNLDVEIHVHPEKDPGCLTRSADLLRVFLKSCNRALVIFDREGCGQDQKSRQDLEGQVLKNLEQAGWHERAAVIVIDPELENWIWSSSPHVATELGWKHQAGPLPTWLCQNGFLENEDQIKPLRPKEAMEAVLKKVRKPRSSAIYRAIAGKVSFERCVDPAFLKLKASLQSWFSETS